MGRGLAERDADRVGYDPRREARRQLARVPLPEDVHAHELDRDARKELLTLAKDTAETVARHLVMAGRLIDQDPLAALAHARAARALAGRVAVAREANGLVAYAAGEWAEALTELRTARRISGDPSHLPVIADCERALGRPERALTVTEDPQSASLDAAARVELLIVASGARRDLGQPSAAAASLQVGALEGPVRPWTARLRYAYADALLDSEREEEARGWFARAAEVDPDGETDAVDRLLALDGILLDDLGQADDAHETAQDDEGDDERTSARLRDLLGGAVEQARPAYLPPEVMVAATSPERRGHQSEDGLVTDSAAAVALEALAPEAVALEAVALEAVALEAVAPEAVVEAAAEDLTVADDQASWNARATLADPPPVVQPTFSDALRTPTLLEDPSTA